MKTKSIPVVFFHEGDHKYLKLAIDCAKRYNEIVYLIGQDCNKSFASNFVNENNLNLKRFEYFESIYKHMSSNSKKFEITAMKKYYVLQAFMIEKKILSCVLLDSDVLAYIDFSKIKVLEKYAAAVSTPLPQTKYEMTSSGHTFYCTIDALNNFISFMEDIYANHIDILEEKYNWHNSERKKGGICDMTLLYLWQKQYENIFNWLSTDEYIVDHSLQTPRHSYPYQFKMDNLLKVKKIKIIDNYPYFFDLKKHHWVKASTLHFQGSSKVLMSCYFQKSIYFVKVFKRYCFYMEKFIRKCFPMLK